MELKIEINEKNMAKIESALNEVQKRSRERTITVKQIMEMPNTLKRHYGIHKKDFEGSVFYIDMNAQNFPNAYKYKPMSTQFEIYCKNGKFRLDGITREQTRREGKRVIAYLSETTKEAILKSAETFNIYI